MKKTVKRVVSLSLVLTMALAAAGCKKESGSNSTTAAGAKTTAAAQKTYTKPTVLNVTWDGTILKEGDEDTDALYAAYNKAYGYTIKWTRPDHSGYKDAINQLFATGSTEAQPDAFLLSAENYVQFAARGLLYDFKEDWEASDIRDDGRFSDSFLASVAELYTVEGRTGELGLYGLPTTRGNGCLTYVRESWLDAIGKKASDIKTWADYYAMLEDMQKANLGDYVVTAAGYISSEAPYTNYLPEFYQDAYPDFIQGEDGTYVDGFQSEAMKKALERLRSAKSAGLLDPDMASNGTSQARTKFIEGKCGVFAYWAGTWKRTLGQNIMNSGNFKDKGADENYGDVVALSPIKEVGAYIERMAPVVVVNKNAADPASVYKYFVEPIYDGAEVMTVWMYGAEDVHWSTKTETLIQELTKKEKYTDANGKDAERTVKTGETKEIPVEGFHFRMNLGGTAQLAKNNIDPLLAVCEYKPGKDPAGSVANAANSVAYAAQTLFNSNCKPAPRILSNSVLAANLNDINTKRREVAAAIIESTMSYDDAMKEYKSAVGSKIDECLKSLNDD